MAVNEFLPFGAGPSPNVLTQAEWNALGARLNGFTAGVADSRALNKAWRQPAFMSAALGLLVSSRGEDALDNGDVPALEAKIMRALGKVFADKLYVDTALAGKQVSGSFVTTSQRAADQAALTNLLAAKQNTGDYATTQALSNINVYLNGLIGDANTVRSNEDTDIRKALGALAVEREKVDRDLYDTKVSRSEFVFSLTDPGYVRLPGGVVFQFGTVTGTGGGGQTTVTFPFAFPNSCAAVMVSEASAGGWGTPVEPTVYGSTNRTRFNFLAHHARIRTSGVVYESGLSFHYIAAGF